MTERDALGVVLKGLTEAMDRLRQACETCHSQNARHYLDEPKKVLNYAIAKANSAINTADFYTGEAKE